jgi:hypothetical protein
MLVHSHVELPERELLPQLAPNGIDDSLGRVFFPNVVRKVLLCDHFLQNQPLLKILRLVVAEPEFE